MTRASSANHCTLLVAGLLEEVVNEMKMPPRHRQRGHLRQMAQRRGAACGSVAVMLRLVRALRGQAEIGGLLIRQLGELYADLVEVEGRDLFVEMLGQRIDLLAVLALLRPKLDLGERLVGEGS